MVDPYHLFPSAHERQIAGRYLYRRRKSRAVALLSVALAVTSAVALAYYFLQPEGRTPLLGALSIVGPLSFVTVLLLNVFSMFSTVAVVGVMLGVAALTVVMAVTSGFQDEIQKRVIGVNTHVLVLKYGTDFREYEQILGKVKEHPQVVAAAPFVFNEMLIAKEGGASAGVLVKGIDVKRAGKVIDLEQRLQPGPGGARSTLDQLVLEQAPMGGGPPIPGVFVGKELSRRLKVRIGDRLRLVAPLLGMDGAMVDDGAGAMPSPRSLEVRIAGIFAAGFDEYDRRLVYVDLARAQQLASQGQVVTGVEMILKDASRARKVSRDLDTLLGGAPYRLLDWEELNHNLFTALALQKAVLGLVLFLIVLVAAFNIVASLTMMVIDKTKEVAILMAMGMPSLSIASVFRAAGMTIGLCGTTLGIAMGLLVGAVVQRLGYLLDAKVYLIDRLPIRISPLEVCGTAAATLLICFLATVYPSLRAASLPPVDGLRYE